jgi:hypothetical protein
LPASGAPKPWDDTCGDHKDRLVEATFDDADRLVRVNFIRIAVHDGWITTEARAEAQPREDGWPGQPGDRLSPQGLAAEHLIATWCRRLGRDVGTT